MLLPYEVERKNEQMGACVYLNDPIVTYKLLYQSLLLIWTEMRVNICIMLYVYINDLK